jgi:glycosyltransferase involved in cell wall biosynthesis
MRSRLKILISAYGCGPARGSEPGVGWHWSKQAAKFHEVWVLTPESERKSIEAYEGQDLPSGLHFLHTDLPRWIRPSNQDTVIRYALHYHLWQLWAYFYVRKLHARVHFDAVHHLTLGAYWKPSFLALLPIPFIWGPVGGGEALPPGYAKALNWRGKIREALRSLVHRIAECDPFVRLTARRSQLTLAKTAATASRVRSLGGREIQVFSEAGIPADELKNLGVLRVRAGGSLRFVSVGRLLQWKGFELGLRAFARIHKEYPDVTYWVIGDGPERRHLVEVSRKLAIADKVKFLGWQSRSQVLESLSACDVLVHPSLHDSGGWVCLEAMAAGRPVICLDLGGPGVQVTNETGFKIPADEPETALMQLAHAMRMLSADRGLVDRLGSAARRRVLEEFAWDQKGKKVADLYTGGVKTPDVEQLLSLTR